MTGKAKFTELGGLCKKMPMDVRLHVVGGLSISGFPLFSGFVSKSMIVTGRLRRAPHLARSCCMLASVGTFLLVGLKVPYFIWFGKTRPAEMAPKPPSPRNMYAAMAIAALPLLLHRLLPAFLYGCCPSRSSTIPYTAYHVSETLQILLFTGLGFFLLLKKLVPEPTISLDMDWFYRMGGRTVLCSPGEPVEPSTTGGTSSTPAPACGRCSWLAGGSAWFDHEVIDGVVDGTAVNVRRGG